MKTRTTQNKKKSNWTPKYSTKGTMQFCVKGVVQEVKQLEERDYVTFKLDNPYAEGNVNVISVEVSWNLPELEEGDKVVIRGNIRRWWNKEFEIITYSFVAEEVEEASKSSRERPKLDITADPLDDSEPIY